MLFSSKLSARFVKVIMATRCLHFTSISRAFGGKAGVIMSPSPSGKELALEPKVPRISPCPVPVGFSRAWATWDVCGRCKFSTHAESTVHKGCSTVSSHHRRLMSSVTFGSISPSARKMGEFLLKFSDVSNMVSHSSSSSTTTGISEKELKRELDELTDQFMETRELLADAMETKGSVYFDEDLQEAKQSVDETLERYRVLLSKLSEEQERNVRRTIGLKMEELRAQEAMIMEQLKDD